MSGNDIAITVQASASEVFLAKYWLADTSKGAPTTTAPDGAGSTGDGLTVTTGTEFEEHTQDIYYEGLTDSSGELVLNVKDDDEDNSWYLNVEINGQVYASDAISFTQQRYLEDGSQGRFLENGTQERRYE